MIYPLGTTVTHVLTFMDKDGVGAADIDRLVQQVFLTSRHDKVGDDVEIVPSTVRTGLGTYEVNYDIPTDIDTDAHQSMTFIYTGYLGTIKKVATKTIPINWKS